MNKVLLINHIGFSSNLYEKNGYFYFNNPASNNVLYLFNHLTNSIDITNLTRFFVYNGVQKLQNKKSKRIYKILLESANSYLGVYQSAFITVYVIVHKLTINRSSNFMLIP
ncbi:hypothetical protein [Paenimyroides baculatum]|uniref:Uncharacterized protein n=1 Tax=Paenimyroides baculatum TaxID=2608000 RepID=A0A5M6CH73_9FLAO|nr:hypothetical protein [Paenimyroides baculatum]KAA5534313.1 hypothetical protein F0460_09400 [Paenimyroides baculatum]